MFRWAALAVDPQQVTRVALEEHLQVRGAGVPAGEGGERQETGDPQLAPGPGDREPQDRQQQQDRQVQTEERPDASVTAVELYDRAFGFLEENIALNGVKVSARRADVLQKPDGFGEFDLIVSNPPYITADEMKTLPAEVLREPHEALLGGADGLTFYRAIAENWLPLLGKGGAFAVEIGCSQAKGVSDIFAAFSPQTDRDYSGLDRVVYGFKPTDSG